MLTVLKNVIKGEFALKNVRIMYKKADEARFISHLDMNRYFARILRKADLPVWFTEGFNPHIYTNFAFPLSLGFESNGEILDIRFVEDFPLAQVADKINAISPKNLQVIDVWEPVCKFTDICFAEYEIVVEGNLYDELSAFLNAKEIIVSKANKKGVLKEINLADEIERFDIEKTDSGVKINIVLPAGNAKTINPSLLIGAFLQNRVDDVNVKYTRMGFLDAKLKNFR